MGVSRYVSWCLVYRDSGAPMHRCSPTQMARFMRPTWGPPGSCRPQMGPMLAPWTLLSGSPGITAVNMTLSAFLCQTVPSQTMPVGARRINSEPSATVTLLYAARHVADDGPASQVLRVGGTFYHQYLHLMEFAFYWYQNPIKSWSQNFAHTFLVPCSNIQVVAVL